MSLGKKPLIYIVAFIFFSLPCWGAKVTKVVKKKRLVWISEGKKHGLKKNKKICFYKKSGKKVGCGKIKKLKSSKAAVKVSKKRIKKIKKGYTTKKTKKGKRIASKKEPSTKKSFGIFLGYSAGGMAPTVSNNIYYISTEKEKDKTLWETDADSSALVFGKLHFINVEANFSFGVAIGLNFGAMPYSHFAPNEKQLTPAENIATTSNKSTSNMSFYIDYYALNLSGLEVGAGVDYHMNASSLEVTDNKDTVLFNQTASLSVISVRIPLRYKIPLSPSMGFALGASIAIPVAGDPVFAELETTDSPVAGTFKKETHKAKLGGTLIADDLTTSWGYKKSSLAANVFVKFYYEL
jgi:hypothetical protein